MVGILTIMCRNLILVELNLLEDSVIYSKDWVFTLYVGYVGFISNRALV